MIDEIILGAEKDTKVKDGLKWIDEQALKKGISFNDMIFEVLYRHDVRAKAKEWLEKRNW